MLANFRVPSQTYRAIPFSFDVVIREMHICIVNMEQFDYSGFVCCRVWRGAVFFI